MREAVVQGFEPPLDVGFIATSEGGSETMAVVVDEHEPLARKSYAFYLVGPFYLKCRAHGRAKLNFRGLV
jgi:hypothetical protein